MIFLFLNSLGDIKGWVIFGVCHNLQTIFINVMTTVLLNLFDTVAWELDLHKTMNTFRSQFTLWVQYLWASTVYTTSCLKVYQLFALNHLHTRFIYRVSGVMVFNTTFNNISVISWRSVLLVEETWVPEENYWPATSHWQTLLHNVESSAPRN